MSVVVRAAEPGEEAAIVPLYEWLFAPPGSVPSAWDPRRAEVALRQAIESHDAAVLLADDDGELVGFCTGYQDMHSVRFGYRAWVEDLAVTRSAARRASARRCSTPPRPGRASAAPPTSSSTPATPGPTPTASTSASTRAGVRRASPALASVRAAAGPRPVESLAKQVLGLGLGQRKYPRAREPIGAMAVATATTTTRPTSRRRSPRWCASSPTTRSCPSPRSTTTRTSSPSRSSSR